jgi:hypothetical protein
MWPRGQGRRARTCTHQGSDDAFDVDPDIQEMFYGDAAS